MITEQFGGLTVVRGAFVAQATGILPRNISVGAFFDRFGAAKWAILADDTPTVQAVVKDASVRQFIWLDNPALPSGLAVLTSAGHNFDASKVINDPVQDAERP